MQTPQISSDLFHIGQSVDVCPPLIAFAARNLMPNLVCLKSNFFIGEFVRSAMRAITRIPEVLLLLLFCQHFVLSLTLIQFRLEKLFLFVLFIKATNYRQCDDKRGPFSPLGFNFHFPPMCSDYLIRNRKTQTHSVLFGCEQRIKNL